MSDMILASDQGSWVEITLNRPERLNAFNDDMHRLLRQKLEAARDDKACRAVLITGAGRGFCAGQDLGDRDPAKMDGPPDLGATIRDFYNPLIRLIRNMDKPVVCAVNGVAAGAGANIALACDIVLAGQSAKFIQSFAKVGLVPDAGGTWSLTHLLGPARAKGLALTGDALPATKAADWGLIWQAVADDQLMAEARKLTSTLADGPTIGLALTKKALEAATTTTFDAQIELEANYQKIAGATPDYAEGVASFLEKRPAKFTGQS